MTGRKIAPLVTRLLIVAHHITSTLAASEQPHALERCSLIEILLIQLSAFPKPGTCLAIGPGPRLVKCFNTCLAVPPPSRVQ